MSLSSVSSLSHVSYATPQSMTAVGAVFPVLGIIAVALRFYTRYIQKAPLKLDDWLTIPVLILTIGMGVGIIIGVQGGGLGYPTPYPDTTNLNIIVTYVSRAGSLTQKVEFAFQLMQVWALGLLKLSVVLFYRRIFCTSKTSKRSTLINIVAGVLVLWTLSFFFSILFSCRTSWYAHWGSILDLKSKCDKTELLLNGFAISDFIMDLFILVLPIPMIWALQMPLRRKFAVLGVFLLGAVAIISSILRMVILITFVRAGFNPIVDPDVIITELLYWSMIESGLALVAACLPTLHFLFANFSPDMLRSSLRSVFSLGSLRYQHPSSHHHVRLDERHANSTASNIHFTSPDPSSIETWAMRDLEGQKDMPQGQIIVKSNICLSENVT